ncbi:TetR family transcriptional regulator [Williamsia limnetica]|uniref:TetR family transcriptional regulator n=1 Tax=Williamsia limnetica TaxID=882452 RepID=A0A318RTH9_WILLI|nr:TetR/AcrR family transcriptional regulator [Williamsia limnetica]PYE19397.1 TetR family transcriptional regulator [Williamsia limnetica]
MEPETNEVMAMAMRAKGQRTEAALQEAAREVFAKKGYFRTKISDITEAAGRSAGSFYNYYDSKEQLLESLLDLFSAEVLDVSLQAKTHDPYATIRTAVAAYFAAYRKYLPELVGVFHLSMTEESFARRWRENRAVGFRSIISGIAQLEKSGHKVDLDHDALASALISMLDSYCWTSMVAGGELAGGPIDDETAIETIAGIWYRAVFAAKP